MATQVEPTATGLVNQNAGRVAKQSPADVLREKLSPLIPMMTKITGDKTYGERALQLLVLCANGNPDLHKCTQASLAASLMKVAQWGLDIGETAYVVPFNVKVSKRGEADEWEKRAQAVPAYTGLMLLAKDSGSVREFLPPRIVYQNDEFSRSYGTDEHLHHVPVNSAKRGPMIGAYVVAVKSMNVRTFVYMELAEIEAIRKNSKQWGPDKVKECPEWYALKTVIRHFTNKLPKKGRKLLDALAADPDVPDGEYEMVHEPGTLASGNVRALGAGDTDEDIAA